MPVFGGISVETLDYILGLANIVNVKKGEYFFREFDQAESMFVLETGRVEMVKNWDGQEFLLKSTDKGGCFGEVALIDLHPRSASVRAIEDSSAIELTTATLHKLYKTNIEQFTMIYMNIARELCRRLRAADSRIFAQDMRELRTLQVR